ncbi:MAG: hypothetical protein ACPGYV_14390 [Phycisphaeraceae bacterium]
MAGPPQDLRNQLPRLRAKQLVRVAFVFVFCLAAWFVFRQPYLESVARASSPILRHFIDSSGQRAIKLDGDTLVVNSGLASPRGEGRMLSLRVDGLYQTGWNALLLGVLIGLTAWPVLNASKRWVLFAVLVVWLTQVATLGLTAVERVADFYAAQGLALTGDAARRAIGGVNQYLMLLTPFLPVLVMLPVWYRGYAPERKSGD